MVNIGKPAVRVLSDGWTAVTKDGSLSAHFEHTVVVTATGCRILTRADGAAAERRTENGERSTQAAEQETRVFGVRM
jgi:hypothetical protein